MGTRQQRGEYHSELRDCQSRQIRACYSQTWNNIYIYIYMTRNKKNITSISQSVNLRRIFPIRLTDCLILLLHQSMAYLNISRKHICTSREASSGSGRKEHLLVQEDKLPPGTAFETAPILSKTNQPHSSPPSLYYYYYYYYCQWSISFCGFRDPSKPCSTHPPFIDSNTSIPLTLLFGIF
jgi:hypothetical protein